jgi:hypothetical protein
MAAEATCSQRPIVTQTATRQGKVLTRQATSSGAAEGSRITQGICAQVRQEQAAASRVHKSRQTQTNLQPHARQHRCKEQSAARKQQDGDVVSNTFRMFGQNKNLQTGLQYAAARSLKKQKI